MRLDLLLNGEPVDALARVRSCPGTPGVISSRLLLHVVTRLLAPGHRSRLWTVHSISLSRARQDSMCLTPVLPANGST